MDDGLDVIMFGDDWGTQSASIVSPELFRRLFKPRYQKLMGPIKKAGRRIFFHSCGQLGELFDELLDLGINGLWPQITLHESTPHQLAACIANKVTVYLHPDRQKLIPFGTPAEIDAKVRGYCELYKKVGGGAIFHVEMENDSPWENVEALVKAIDQYR
jgi:uroporphyrinogen decarboxylase